MRSGTLEGRQRHLPGCQVTHTANGPWERDVGATPGLTAVPVPGWQVYYVYGFMLLVFLILIIVTVCVTIVGTYFLLNAENYHWQWTSFFSAASTAAYVYLYSIYYYFMKTKMSGFFQTTFYFGYTLMFCLGLGILCGKWRGWVRKRLGRREVGEGRSNS